MIRHGDVLLVPTGVIPLAAADAKPARAILAHGEFTGHAHRVVGAGLTFDGDTLTVPRQARLDHEEHGLIVLEPNTYNVVRQREYVEPRVTRRVRD